ncbi:hypothetical protein SAMN04488104_101614 [Algoriphagus faecimaris]|uniref:Uncharacterized protein n=1 Tax=Algoriphagus faecimaris TaxID=686796 RepID=A0A1G6S9B0_9BACT|nr:hypothetical protein [Algoriphagus faecimaris]SDD13502.1 hypothetical protein SAMN04488104_101614 [Algoriphagus faecimaris]
MLQDLIKDLQSNLKSYSQGLAKQNILVDIPWTMVGGDLNLQRLIFRKDNSLYIVKEGEIQESTWEYLPAMNSLVITLAGKKILMNEVFVDGKALILKRDGIAIDFLAFANENELPDLNLIDYFKNIESFEKLSFNPNMDENQHDTSNGEYFGIFIILAVILMIIVLSLTN